MTRSEKRAARLKHARPDIAQLVGNHITEEKAVQIGGYADAAALRDDLDDKLQQKMPQSHHEGAKKSTSKNRKKK
jgi:hypothetical protein